MEITLGSIVSYVVGIPLALLGLLLTIQSPFGLIPLLAGLLIIPVIHRQLAKRVGIEFSRGATTGIGGFGVVAGVVILVVVALSGSGGAPAPPGADVSNVTITAEDASPPEADTSLQVVWSGRAQSAVDPDPNDISVYNSNEGEKFLVVRMEITNAGNEQLELSPRLFRVEAEGVEYEYQSLFGSGNSFSGITLNPDSSYAAWTAFSIPEETEEARLIVNQDTYFQKNVSISFSQDSEMAINMSD
jgi:hypothetical protein